LAVERIVYLYALEIMLKRGFWFFGLLIMGSCLEKPDCFLLSNNYIGISFKKMFDGKADTLSLIGITSSSTDVVFYPFTRASGIQLELNPYASSTDFLVETIFGNHLLNLEYRSTIQFVSEDCGVRTTITDFNLADFGFDSVRVVNPFLTNPATVNLEVYRCPRTNQLKLAFKKLENNSEVADSVQLNNVTADYGGPFYFPGGKITTLNLPLNPLADATTFTFEFSDGVVRTLTVQHTRTGWSEYEACGDLTLFFNLASTASTFSQVTVVRDSIQDPPLTNFAIYK
jgi:hypothetical protein